MDEIPTEDLKDFEMDEVMDSDESDDSDKEDEEDEVDDENDSNTKEAFIPGRHKLEKDEELVRDER